MNKINSYAYIKTVHSHTSFIIVVEISKIYTFLVILININIDFEFLYASYNIR